MFTTTIRFAIAAFLLAIGLTATAASQRAAKSPETQLPLAKVALSRLESVVKVLREAGLTEEIAATERSIAAVKARIVALRNAIGGVFGFETIQLARKYAAMAQTGETTFAKRDAAAWSRLAKALARYEYRGFSIRDRFTTQFDSLNVRLADALRSEDNSSSSKAARMARVEALRRKRRAVLNEARLAQRIAVDADTTAFLVELLTRLGAATTRDRWLGMLREVDALEKRELTARDASIPARGELTEVWSNVHSLNRQRHDLLDFMLDHAVHGDIRRLPAPVVWKLKRSRGRELKAAGKW